MKMIAALAAMLAAPLLAQTTPTAPGAYTAAMENRNFERSASSYYEPGARHDTPAQAEARLAKANALKAEATQLASADGGTMSSSHRAYIRRKADAILRN